MAVMRFVALTVGLCLIVGGCTDNDLVTASRALQEVAVSVGTIQTSVIEGNQQGLISDEDTRQILTVAVAVNEAGLKATAITRNLAKLETQDRQALLSILRPVIQGVSGAITGLPLGITPNVRSNILTSLQAIQASLNIAQIALAGG